GAGEDSIPGGAAGDTIRGGAGDDVILGDNGQFDYNLPSDAIDGRLDITSVTLDSDPATLDRVMTAVPTIGGPDTIYGNGGNDVIFGGTGDDAVYGDTGDTPAGDDGSDILMGDHAKFFSISYLPWGQNVFAIDTGAAAGAGDDHLYGNGGDDFLFGQQGNDFLYGGAGEDDMTGGSNVIGAVDGGVNNDFMDGGDGADVMLGDNGLILRTQTGSHPYPWATWPAPSAQDVIRTVTRYDDIDKVGGDDTMYGQAGEDIMYGQRGDDTMSGGDGTDEMIGGLGDDTMSGDAGRDYMLGDQGYFIRVLNANGSARMDADGTFHRDCFLEDVGTITGVVPLDKTAPRTPDPDLGAKIALADMTVISGVYNADGSKHINADTGAWDTEGLLIDLVAANDDTMNGGDGNDFMVGQRGDDHMNGDGGDDLVVGDGITNVSPFRTDVPQVIQGVRLIAADASVPVTLNPLGSVIVPQLTVYPDEMNNFAMPALTALTPVAGALKDAAAASALDRTDGRTMTPYIAVIPDVTHHADVLPGNDTLHGGEGNDTVVGDNAVFFAPLLTGMPDLDKAVADLTAQLIGVAQALHELSLDYEVYEHDVLGLTSVKDVYIGQDDVSGDAGNDTLFGDNAMFASAFMTGLPSAKADFSAAATEFCGLVKDLRDMAVDFGFVVQEGHLQVLTSLTADALAKNPGRVKPAAKDVTDPAYHVLHINGDAIQTGSGNDMAFGDEAIIFAPAVNGQIYKKPIEYLQITQATYNAAKKAVVALAKVRDKALADHVKSDHATAADFRSRMPAPADLALVTFPYEYSRYVGNDTLTGGDGNDLMEADIAVLTMPVIVTNPTTPKEIAQAAKDVRAITGVIKTYVGQIAARNVGKTLFDKGNDFTGKRQAGADSITYQTACDTIMGGTGTNVIFGGGLFFTTPFNTASPGVLLNLGSINVEMPAMQNNRHVGLVTSGQKLVKLIANDDVTVNGINDTVFAGGGKNAIVVGPGATGTFHKTSGSVPDAKTLVPM
ncbi:MAG: calcium-binding protein, partial [Planctomycetota bacterium]|nr:calcium-binding protein [Planctomycetota bacterium]